MHQAQTQLYVGTEQVKRSLYPPHRASPHSRDLHWERRETAMRLGKAAPGHRARRRASGLLQSPLLIRKAQAARCTASARRGGRSRSGRLRSAPAARRSAGARPRRGSAAAGAERRAELRCAGPAPSTHRESRGSGREGKFKNSRERCRPMRGVGKAAAAWPGGGCSRLAVEG